MISFPNFSFVLLICLYWFDVLTHASQIFFLISFFNQLNYICSNILCLYFYLYNGYFYFISDPPEIELKTQQYYPKIRQDRLQVSWDQVQTIFETALNNLSHKDRQKRPHREKQATGKKGNTEKVNKNKKQLCQSGS